MGAERAFRPGTFAVSGLWSATSFVLSFGAAIAGGRVGAAIGRGSRPVALLAAGVVVLGLLLAVPAWMAPEDPAAMQRSGDIGNFAAFQKARQPKWVAALMPFVGGAGVLLGGRRR
jgi:hypothetical protein